MTDSLLGPSRRFVLVTGSAGIGNSVLVRHGRGNEAEGVSMNKSAGNAFRLDRGHVTSNANTAGTTVFVVCVFFERGRARPIR